MELVPQSSDEFQVWPPEKFRTSPTLSELFLWRISPKDSRNRDAKCRACGATSLKTKPDRCINHLRNCPQKQNIDSQLLNETLRHCSRAPKTQERASKVTTEMYEVDKMIVELIAVNLLPLSIVESDELCSLVRQAFPSYSLPSRKKLSSKLVPRVAQGLRGIGFQQIKLAPSYTLTLECDAWTSVAGSSIVAVTLTQHSGESYLLDLIDASRERHTAEYLAEIIINSLRAKEVPLKRINCLVTDEASNMKKARELICSSLDEHHIFHYRCMAHTFNLIIGSVCQCPQVRPDISKLVALIRKVESNKYLLTRLKDSARAPVKIVPTRWYSVSSSIKSMVDLREDLYEATRDSSLRAENLVQIVEDDGFWIRLKQLYVYFSEISKMIGVAEASNSRLSNSFRAFLEFLRFLEANVVAPMRNIVFEASLTHLGKIDINLVICAYALDPNHKLEFLTKKALEKVEFVCLTMLIDMGYDETVALQLRSELVSYKNLIKRLGSFVEDIYEWWSKQSLRVLRKVGLRMAACHGSSANTERIFSTLNSTITPSRNRLGIELAFDLTSVRVLKLSKRKRQINRRRSSSSSTETSLEVHELEDDSLEMPICASIENSNEESNFEDLSGGVSSIATTLGHRHYSDYIDFSSEPSPVGSQATIRPSVDSASQARRALESLGPLFSNQEEAMSIDDE